MPQPESPPPVLVRGLILVLLAGMLACCFALWTWLEISREQRAVAGLTAQIAACQAPAPVEQQPTIIKPPTDEALSPQGYIGDDGRTLHGLMNLQVEQARGGQVRKVRLGDHRVLATQTIHIINLWNVHCEPCKEELPALRKLFNRRSDWRSNVAFVALQVLDDQSPQFTYQQVAPWMPPQAQTLADRSRQANVTTVLGRPENGQIYGGLIPITLVLDCNRRVRWRSTGALGEAELQDLERHVDTMRQELFSDGPGQKCSEVFCGNGRCDPGETSRGSVCEEDCGPVRFVTTREHAKKTPTVNEPVKPTVEPLPIVPKAVKVPTITKQKKPKKTIVPQPEPGCPPGCRHCVKGQCIELLGEPEPIVQPGVCGDGVCGGGENDYNCCQDCGCQPGLECREHIIKGWTCQRGLIGP